jgi:hypothetical protein
VSRRARRARGWGNGPWREYSAGSRGTLPGQMEALRLTDDEVKVHLRQAVTAGIIWGWYRHLPLKGREWVVNPMAGPCVSYDRDGIRSFCEMLDAV